MGLRAEASRAPHARGDVILHQGRMRQLKPTAPRILIKARLADKKLRFNVIVRFRLIRRPPIPSCTVERAALKHFRRRHKLTLSASDPSRPRRPKTSFSTL